VLGQLGAVEEAEQPEVDDALLELPVSIYGGG
jgi:hypothetical protein